MKAYAAVFFTGACFAGCFVDNGLKPSVYKVGRLALAVFTVLFAVSEMMVLVG